MSGYLARLAARAGGRPMGATLAPRLAPAIAGQGVFAAETDTAEETAAGRTITEQQSPEHERESRPEQPAVDVPVAGPPTVSEPTAPERSPGRSAALPVPERNEAAALLPATSADYLEPAPSEIAAGARPSRPRRARAQRPPAAGPRTPVDAADITELQAVVELRPRSTAAVPPSAGAYVSRQAGSPPVEVRIGRVEVRPPRAAPPAPASPTRPQPAPALDPFARLAAARRYVDRVWS